jgi:hypothetical protein
LSSDYGIELVPILVNNTKKRKLINIYKGKKQCRNFLFVLTIHLSNKNNLVVFFERAETSPPKKRKENVHN